MGSRIVWPCLYQAWKMSWVVFAFSHGILGYVRLITLKSVIQELLVLLQYYFLHCQTQTRGGEVHRHTLCIEVHGLLDSGVKQDEFLTQTIVRQMKPSL